jgi:hypothetical protein
MGYPYAEKPESHLLTGEPKAREFQLAFDPRGDAQRGP